MSINSKFKQLNEVLVSKFKNNFWNQSGLHAFSVFLVMLFSFSVWTHHSFQGNYWGPFLPGQYFGVPEKEANQLGIYPTSPIGWDAQFYYYQSNDLFARKDAAIHIDNPPYRYQRIGMPLIAGSIAFLLGFDLTPPFLYHFLQILIISFGFFFLISWLKENNKSSFWAYGWLLSAGVLNALFFGMPDPVGDAFFIMSLIFALKKNLKAYSFSTIFLLLIREGYAAFAAIIFILTLFKKISWKENSRLKQIFFTMLPGIIVVAWMAFVTYKFGKTPIEAGSGSTLTDYPFYAAWKEFLNAIANNHVWEVILKQVGVIILLSGIYYTYENRKHNAIWYAVLAYFFLMASLGTTIWFDYSGYLKAAGSVLVGIIILLPNIKNRLIYLLLIFMAVHGLWYNFQSKQNLFYSKWPQIETIDVNEPNNEQLKSYNSLIETEINPIWQSYKGLFQKVHRETKRVKIKITNTSNEIWYAKPETGMYSINVSYHWYDKDGKTLLIDGIRTPIGKTLNPGESLEKEMEILIPKAGEYILRLSLIQEGVAWFYQAGGGQKDIFIKVE